MKTKRICNKLNKLISEKKEGFIDEVNKIIYELYQKGGEMYWNREVWINNNCDDKRYFLTRRFISPPPFFNINWFDFIVFHN